jgi:hypothetical protein
MALWSANDDPTGKPKWANTAAVFGVDRTEATVYGKGMHPGWVNVTPMRGYVSNITVSNAGSGYANADTFVIANGVSGANGSGTMITADAANSALVMNVGTTVNVSVTTGNALAVYANSDTFFYFSNSTNKIYKVINKVVNSSFINLASNTSLVANGSANNGLAAQISSIGLVDGGGFTSQTGNVNITTSTGSGGSLTIGSYGGRIGRTSVECLVAISDMKSDDSDDTTLPDS